MERKRATLDSEEESAEESEPTPTHESAAEPINQDKRFLTIALPKLTLDEVWERELDDVLGSGQGSRIHFNNRRGTGGTMHYATVAYDQEGVAGKIANRSGEMSYGGKKMVLATCTDASDPTEVEILNLDLPKHELLRQLSLLGSIVAHRFAERQLKATLVYATRSGALKSLQFNGKAFKGQTVSVRLLPKHNEAVPPVVTTPPTPPPVRPAKRAVQRRKVPKQLIYQYLTDDIKDKVVSLRKNKEKVMSNLKIIKREIKAQDMLGSKQDAKKMAVLTEETERLTQKRAKIRKALIKLCKSSREKVKDAMQGKIRTE
eukprot:TRINITY_DN7019_c0_g2_i1.p1 TRINITY_DN7019_c0_g2~~TRINITY_DN7019_c0_g2_i1.p1  ORF type:complete len:338 (+),score=97.51 TRINITY_DN7019_c0_g2_i1:66-1016(+)